MEKERRSLETSLKDRKVEMDSISFQLCKLQRQRDSCRQEVRIVEEELATQRRMALEDGVCMERKQTSVVVSVLEREEMERQLDSAKTELFAEQRRARDKLDSMQEKLEEAREELQRVTEEESSLRHRCACLEEKQRQRQEQMEALDCQVSELKGELGECTIKVGSLEKILAQRELQLLVLQEEHSALETERDALQGELQNLRKQHGTALKEAQEQAKRVMMAELEQKSKELALAHEQRIQMVHKKAEEEKASALTEQALSLKCHIESMQSSIKLKQEEARELRESLEQQWKMAKKREDMLHADALEKVHKAIVEERRKWEAEKLTAVQVHCGILEEQSRKSLERVRSEVEQEKRNALALQNKVVELHTRVEELESEACMQKREQESVLAVMCKSLKEEHQVELQRLHKHMEQESQQQVVKLEQAVQLAEEEADSLRKLLGESGSSHKQATARLEQQLRHWACELGAECQHLRLLLELSGARGATVQLPHSPTMAEALQNLQTLREQLEHKIRHLKQELDSQKQTHKQLIQDKERELHIQREQMGTERDQALDFLKERLIKEHIEDLSSLSRAHICEGGDEGKGVAASLRKQLKAKDLELRQVQRSMSEWKDQTAARLARKFEEELTAELERKMSKSREDFQEKPETPEGEMTVTARQCNDSGAQYSVSHPSSHAASPATSDMTSFKLLRHLQSRVTQLRAENQAYACSPSPLKRIPFDLSGSYLETITQSQDSVQIQSHPSIRMVPS
ncbi:trichohyalin isoform X2 [Myripristis murdjan]|nr:trichohyalin-like isoform X2 [Myripristis murdjan]